MFKRKGSQYLSLNKPKRSNWFTLWGFIFIIISFILLTCLVFGIILYNNLYESKTEGYSETRNSILDQTSIVEIDDLEHFYGEEAYHIVYGRNEQDEEKLIFYPLEGEERNITTVDQTDIVSKEQIVYVWQEECSSCRFIDVSPAFLDGEALWEVAYYDEQERYILTYFSMDDAAVREQLLFKSMFN